MKKALNYTMVVVTALLMGLPLLMPVLQLASEKVLSSYGSDSTTNGFIQWLFNIAFESELAIVHIAFIFACFAGILTSYANKHLKIGAFSDYLPPKAKKVVENVVHVFSVSILIALFFACFPNILSTISPDQKIWNIPIRIIFICLPLMYFGMALLELKKDYHIALKITGVIIGLAVSVGSILTIMYQLFGLNPVFLSDFFDVTTIVLGKLFIPFVLIFIVFAFFGLPLYIVFAGISYVAFMQGGGYVDIFTLETYKILIDKGIAAIPLFTIAGCLLAEGSAGRRLTNFIKTSVGWLKGGTIITTVLVATLFTTFTGASGVTILALGGILTLILTGNGATEDDAESLVTASSSIGILLPPSLAVIIYGVTNIFGGASIIDIFKGALIPGFLLTLSTIIFGIIRDKNMTRAPFSKSEFKNSFSNSILELLLPILIFVLFFTGWLSLLQIAAFTAVYTFVLEVFVRKDFTVKGAFKSILNNIPVVGGVLAIVGVAKGLAYYLYDANVAYILSDFVITHVSSKYVFLFLLNILLLVVGCIMDLYSAILVVSPLILPIAESFGIHPVHTAVIFLTNLSLGFLTPPVGMNLFIASYTFKKPVLRIVKNTTPYLAIQLIILLLITYVPWFSMVFIN